MKQISKWFRGKKAVEHMKMAGELGVGAAVTGMALGADMVVIPAVIFLAVLENVGIYKEYVDTDKVEKLSVNMLGKTIFTTSIGIFLGNYWSLWSMAIGLDIAPLAMFDAAVTAKAFDALKLFLEARKSGSPDKIIYNGLDVGNLLIKIAGISTGLLGGVQKSFSLGAVLGSALMGAFKGSIYASIADGNKKEGQQQGETTGLSVQGSIQGNSRYGYNTILEENEDEATEAGAGGVVVPDPSTARKTKAYVHQQQTSFSGPSVTDETESPSSPASFNAI